jgi:glucose-6-phosphate isomerase
VPSGLAGADLEQLLDEAESVADLLADDDAANPGLRLGAAMAGTIPLRDKLVLADEGSGLPGFADWAEQLIAESTGKQGTGILPVVVQGGQNTGLSQPSQGTQGSQDFEVRSPGGDITIARLVEEVDDEVADDDTAYAGGPSRSEVQVSGSLGAQLLLWQVATVVAGRILGINPFDQPDVESAKKATRGLLEAAAADTNLSDPPAFTDGAIEVRALGGSWLGDGKSVASAVDSLLAQPSGQGGHGYVAVMAYLDRLTDAPLAGARRTIADRSKAPTTFGWGPRFLHSTGQYHKGGPANGVYLQITAAPQQDLAIPGRDFTFGDFITAQAGGDAQVLADRGRPVLRLHLTDHDAGLAQLAPLLGLDRPDPGGSPVKSGTGTDSGS